MQRHYLKNYVMIDNKPFINHMDYGLSRGFIVSPVGKFPYKCAPHRQEIRLVIKPRESGIETPFDVIALVPGRLDQPITMPGLDYGPRMIIS